MEECNPRIYESFLNTFFKAYNSNQQLMLLRFDLQLPKNFTGNYNTLISTFVRRIKQRVYRKSLLGEKQIVCELFWVRERSRTSPNPHFHVILFISTNIIQNKEDVFINFIDPLWNLVLKTNQKGLVHYCEGYNDNGIIFSKASIENLLNHPQLTTSLELQEKYKEVVRIFEHAKYLAKCTSKMRTENDTKMRSYSGSKNYEYTQEEYEKIFCANPHI